LYERIIIAVSRRRFEAAISTNLNFIMGVNWSRLDVKGDWTMRKMNGVTGIKI